jgi:predicted ribosomally synthesized peptide with SipW-like signal peptide
MNAVDRLYFGCFTSERQLNAGKSREIDPAMLALASGRTERSSDMAVVRVISKDGRLLSPTTRCDHVRILLKEGKAKVVGNNPFTIQLLTDSDQYFTFNQMKGRKVMSNAKKKNMVIVVAMIAVLAIGSIAAYFTATDSATNSFVVGSVEIDQVEPAWEVDGAEAPTLTSTPDNTGAKGDRWADHDGDGVIDSLQITPNHEFKKDPQVINKGENDAYVYMMVAIPKKTVRVANSETGANFDSNNSDATPYVEQETQLFQMNAVDETATDTVASVKQKQLQKDQAGLASYSVAGVQQPVYSTSGNADTLISNQPASWTGVDTWDENWYLLAVNPETASGKQFAAYKDNYNIYLFAYATSADSETATLTKLAGERKTSDQDNSTTTGATTPALFDSITMANLVNINDLIGTSDEDHIDYDSKTEFTAPEILVKSFAIQCDNLGAANTTDAAEVWSILNNQDEAYKAFADELNDLDTRAKVTPSWQTATENGSADHTVNTVTEP